MKKYQVKVVYVFEIEAEDIQRALGVIDVGTANGGTLVDYSMSAEQVDDPTERVQGALQQFLPFLASLMGHPEPDPPTVPTGAKPATTDSGAFEVDTTDIDADAFFAKYMGDV